MDEIRDVAFVLNVNMEDDWEDDFTTRDLLHIPYHLLLNLTSMVLTVRRMLFVRHVLRLLEISMSIETC